MMRTADDIVRTAEGVVQTAEDIVQTAEDIVRTAEDIVRTAKYRHGPARPGHPLRHSNELTDCPVEPGHDEKWVISGADMVIAAPPETRRSLAARAQVIKAWTAWFGDNDGEADRIS
jgi:hypothetical protein